MSFEPGWLALREPYDAVAREMAGLTPHFAAMLPDRPRLLDLGCGTGSNIRYLLLRIGRMNQHWTAVDHDPVLLARVLRSFPPFVAQTDPLQFDLNDFVDLPIAGVDAVTTNALLDLCSAQWMERLADRLAEAALPFLATLTVDGRIRFEPEDRDDGFVLGLVDGHMRIDKGFGPAMGPDAPGLAVSMLEKRGFQVQTADSDWEFSPEDGQMQHVLIHTYAIAAMEADPDQDGRIAAWADRRHAQIGTLLVGHRDVLAVPAARAKTA